jgi:uncharacterized protein (TIGR02246 family)
MKKILVAALVASIAMVAAESSAASQAGDAIKQVLAEFDRCFSNNDAKCVGEMFIDDATYAAPTGGAKIVKGKAEIVKALGESMAAVKKAGWTLAHTIDNVRTIGEDHAFVDTTVKISGMKVAADNPGARDSYRAVAIMVLQDGTWRCKDLRSYAISPGGRQDTGSPEEKQPAAPEKNEPAPPTQG